MPPKYMAGLSHEENLDAIRFDANNAGERKRLEKNLNDLVSKLSKIELKLNNKSFIEKAPSEIIQSNFNKQKYFQKEINSLKELIECLSY